MLFLSDGADGVIIYIFIVFIIMFAIWLDYDYSIQLIGSHKYRLVIVYFNDYTYT